MCWGCTHTWQNTWIGDLPGWVPGSNAGVQGAKHDVAHWVQIVDWVWLQAPIGISKVTSDSVFKWLFLSALGLLTQAPALETNAAALHPCKAVWDTIGLGIGRCIG